MKNQPIRRTLHLSEGLCDALKMAAGQDRRTVSSMAEVLLREALKTHKQKQIYGSIPSSAQE